MFTLRLEVEQRGQESTIWQPSVWITQLIEKGMNHGIQLQHVLMNQLYKTKNELWREGRNEWYYWGNATSKKASGNKSLKRTIPYP